MGKRKSSSYSAPLVQGCAMNRGKRKARELKSWSSGFMVAFLFLCITILTVMGVKRSLCLFGTADIQCIG
ncbi:hypothetical protein EJ110_NYTH03591 [Nymphaea thermarum]|nr:hypothetical protein EJ110_NYTH03591 [Nymphaea thermarum]